MTTTNNCDPTTNKRQAKEMRENHSHKTIMQNTYETKTWKHRSQLNANRKNDEKREHWMNFLFFSIHFARLCQRRWSRRDAREGKIFIFIWSRAQWIYSTVIDSIMRKLCFIIPRNDGKMMSTAALSRDYIVCAVLFLVNRIAVCRSFEPHTINWIEIRAFLIRPSVRRTRNCDRHKMKNIRSDTTASNRFKSLLDSLSFRSLLLLLRVDWVPFGWTRESWTPKWLDINYL